MHGSAFLGLNGEDRQDCLLGANGTCVHYPRERLAEVVAYFLQESFEILGGRKLGIDSSCVAGSKFGQVMNLKFSTVDGHSAGDQDLH